MGDDTKSGAQLGRSFLFGSMYLGIASWVTSALSFAINIVLARVLGPEVLGFYAFVFSVNEILNMIGAFSLGLAVIQAPRESQRLYDTAVAISAALGLIGLVAAAVIAPVLAVYRSGLAAWFLVILALKRVMELVARIPLSQLERSLRFGTAAAIGLATANLPNLCAVILALLGAGAWSLLARDVLVGALALLLAVWLSGYRFRRDVDRPTARQLMSFASPFFLSRALEIAMERVDRLVIGASLGDVKLGFYNQARTLSETGLIVARPLTRLTFNLYSRLQEESTRLSRAYGIVNYFLVRMIFSGAVTLLIFPRETILLLLGEEWLGAAPILGWLAVYAALLPLQQNMVVLLYARKAMRQSVWMRVIQLGIFLPGLVVGVVLDDTIVVAGSLLFVTCLGISLASYFNREIVGAELIGVLLGPSLCVVGTVLSFLFAVPAGVLDSLPTWILPFLPPVVYAVLLLAIERARLFREFGYLRRIARGSP